MTFKELATLLAPRAEALCRILLPNGKRSGREWIAGSTQGEAGRSLKVVLEGPKAGTWKDFSSDEGGDLLKLIEQCRQCTPPQAADFARDFMGLPPWEPDRSTPPPFDPLSMGFKRSDDKEWSKGTAAWAYRDAAGAVVCYAVRFDFPDGKKDVLPMRMVDGKWRWKGFAAPLKPPVFGLDLLAARPDAPVLIVEGEKTAAASAKLFPGHVCITWLGGCKAVKKVDWTPVLERKVFLWPDADEPGRDAMNYLHQLVPGSVLVRTSELPDGWDLADPVPEGMNVHGMLDGAAVKAKAREKEVKEKEKKDEQRKEKEKYHLPRGCKLNDVLADINEYGLFEYAGQVYSVWFGSGVKGKFAERVSNFTCRIEAHIKLPEGNALKLITIKNIHGEQDTYHVSGDAMLTLPTFRKVTAGDKGNFDWNATDLVYRHYLRRMQDKMGNGRIIRELGQQPEGFFVMSNVVLNGKVEPIDKHGCFEHEGKRYYVPASKVVPGMPGAFANAQRLRYITSKLTWRQFTEKMRQVHREHSFTSIVFAVGTAFRDVIHEQLGGYPLLYYYGDPGSGKDQCIDGARRLYGKPQPVVPLTGANTGPGMTNMMAEFRCIPMCYGEWRNDMKMETQHVVFGYWEGTGRRRGTKTMDTSPYATDSVPVECTVYLTGNDYPNVEEKGMTRFVIEVMETSVFSAEESEAYLELKDMGIDGYSHLLAPIIAERTRFEREWYEGSYKPAQALITKALGGVPLKARMHQNISTLLSVYLFFEKTLDWAFTRDEFVKHLVAITLDQQAKLYEGDAVSDFWTCFITAKRKGAIQEDVHYRIDGDRLAFFWGELHPVYEETYGTLRRRNPALNDTTMLNKLKKHSSFLETVATMSIGGRKSRAQVFAMSRTGTELKGLLTTDTPADRHLGDHDDEPVLVKWGNRGPYVKVGKRFRDLPKGMDHATVTLEAALALLFAKRAVVAGEPVPEGVDDLPF